MTTTRQYWEQIADSFETEIFDVLSHDRAGLILNLIEEFGSRECIASDLGCGIGAYLPYLSEAFKEVVAVDVSRKCIAKAKRRCSELENVSFRIADLADPRTRLPQVDFALSVNCILTPSLARRNRIFHCLVDHLLPGAHLVLVVPALESALLTDFRLIEWNLKTGMEASAAVRAGFPTRKQSDNARLREGVVLIDDVRTKHYLREELITMLETQGMKVLDVLKIEYSWKTEFESPPRWMKGPYPWDWLLVAQREAGTRAGRT